MKKGVKLRARDKVSEEEIEKKRQSKKKFVESIVATRGNLWPFSPFPDRWHGR